MLLRRTAVALLPDGVVKSQMILAEAPVPKHSRTSARSATVGKRKACIVAFLRFRCSLCRPKGATQRVHPPTRLSSPQNVSFFLLAAAKPSFLLRQFRVYS